MVEAAEETGSPGQKHLTLTHWTTSWRPGGWLLLALYALALGSYLCEPLSDPEIFRDLALSRWIHGHGALPATDQWTELGAGRAFLHPPEIWLSLIGAAETRFGWPGLIVLKLALIFVSLFGCSVLYARLSGDRFFAALVATLVACGSLSQASLNSTLVALAAAPLIALAADIFWSTRDRRRDSSGTENGTTTWARTGVIIFAAVSLLLLCSGSTHGARLWVILFSLASLLFARHSGRSVTVLATGAALLAFTLGNDPDSGLLPLTAAVLLDAPKPSTVFDYPFGFVLLLSGVAVLLRPRDRTSLPARRAIILAVFAVVLASGSHEFVPLAAVLMGTAVAVLWRETPPELPFAQGIIRARTALGALNPTGPVWLLGCIVIVNTVNNNRLPVIDALLPAREIDDILLRPESFPLWHPADVGGYLIWRFANERGEPSRKIRADRSSLLLRPDALRQEQSGAFADSFQALAPRTALVQIGSPAFEALRMHPGWKEHPLDGNIPNPGMSHARRANRFAWAIFIKEAP